MAIVEAGALQICNRTVLTNGTVPAVNSGMNLAVSAISSPLIAAAWCRERQRLGWIGPTR